MRANSAEQWIRQSGAFEAIIDPDLFARAQQHRMQRRICLSDRKMLARLASLLREKGSLSKAIIDKAGDTPTHGAYINRFGSLRNAYRMIAHDAQDNLLFADAKRKNGDIIDKIVADLTRLLDYPVEFDTKRRDPYDR